MYLQRLLIYLSLAALAAASNLVKKEIKEPNVQLDTSASIQIIQQPKKPSAAAAALTPAQLDSSFMPVFLTSNVKASDFTQEMLKSLATNSYVKPSVKLSNKSNSSPHKSSNSAASRSGVALQASRKPVEKPVSSVKSETVSTRWSKAGSTSNFSPVLPISLSKMHFDTTGFIPIIPKQATRSSSNAKLIKQASKPISKPTVNAKTIPLPKQVAAITSSGAAKRKSLVIDLNKLAKESLPNPSVRALKSIKSNIKSTNAKQAVSTAKPNSTTASAKQASRRPSAGKNAKIVDNRPIAASSSTELNSYLSSQLTSRDARKALLQMNTLRYLAKLSPQWSASSLSETYQPTQTKIAGSTLNAYPIGKITIPASEGSSYGGGQKKPEISIELIKEILHKLTNDEMTFNKLYVMGTHRYKPNSNEQSGYGNNQADAGSPDNGGAYQTDNGGAYQTDNGGDAGGYQPAPENDAGYQSGYQQDQGGSYQENSAGYGQQENSGGYSQPEGGGYSQPDYSQDQGGNAYQGGNYENSGGGGDSYSNEEGNSYTSGGPAESPYPNEENSYSNEGNSYNSNEGGSYGSNGGESYGSNEGNAYNTDNGNSYQGGGGGDSDQEQGYQLQSLGYDMSQYDNRAYVPAYSLHSLASFVHSKFKETAYKKQMGEYQYTDNPFMNNYENYKSMDVNYAQYVPDQQANGMGGGRKKCSKNHNNNNNGGGGGGGGYANNDVNFDDSYNNYVIKIVHPGANIDFK